MRSPRTSGVTKTSKTLRAIPHELTATRPPSSHGSISGSATKAAKSRFAGIRYNAVPSRAPEKAVQATLIALVGTSASSMSAACISGWPRSVAHAIRAAMPGESRKLSVRLQKSGRGLRKCSNTSSKRMLTITG